MACEEAVAGWVAAALWECQKPGPESPCVPESQASPCRPNLRRSGANPRKPPRFGPLITSLHSGSTDTRIKELALEPDKRPSVTGDEVRRAG